MKSKDLFKKLKDQGKIANDDYDKFVESVPEFEVPDTVFASIEDNFLTRERATADPKIVGKIRAEVFDAVDENLKGILPVLDVFSASEIDKETDTFKKLKLFKKAIPDTIDKAKKANPDEAEKVKELNKQNAELLEKIAKINSEKEVEKTNLQKGFEEEKKSILLDWSLRDKLSKFTLADEHKDLREAITTLILTDVKGKEKLTLDEKGQIVVIEEIVNGVPKPKFKGNDQVTIDELLAEKVKPYLKRNNADEKPKPEPGHTTTKTIATTDTDPSKLTLAQRRAQAAMA